MANLFTLALFGALFAIIPFFLDQMPPFRKEYVTYDKGAVIVTGASTGIGRHAATYIAQNHPGVFVWASVRKESDAETIQNEGLVNLAPLMIDVADQESVDAAVEQVEETLRQENLVLIGLVNNAGISSNAPLEFLPMTKLRQLLEVNVVGPTYLTQKLTKLLRESHGRVVQVSNVPSPIVSLGELG
jgi:NAD(P)-dependent dehydrogenase (short-subunit alcohol dehydrogenase family)